jgi:hypothetical protein
MYIPTIYSLSIKKEQMTVISLIMIFSTNVENSENGKCRVIGGPDDFPRIALLILG